MSRVVAAIDTDPVPASDRAPARGRWRRPAVRPERSARSAAFQPPWRALEAALVVLAAVASVALTCYVGRRTWFRIDVWDFLVRSQEGSVDSWLRPHGAHLQVPAVALHRFLYAVFGMDFWPWYYLPHILSYTGLVFYLWRVLLARGSNRIVALFAYLVMLFLGAAAFMSSVVVGGMLAVALLLVIATRLDADGEPSLRQRLVVLGAFLLVVVSTSLGVAVLAGGFLGVAVSRRLRWWWWCFPPAAIAYVAWYLAYGGHNRRSAIVWGRMLEIPGGAVRLLGTAWRDLTGLPGQPMVWGAIVVLALLLGLGWLVWRRQARCWDWVLIFTFGAYLAMLLLARGVDYSTKQERYAYLLITLAVPLVVPHLRRPRALPAGEWLATVALVGVALLGFNAWQRVEGINKVEASVRRTRIGVEAVATVIAGGEPAIDDLRLSELGIRLTAGLTVRTVRGFVADGWAPTAEPGKVEALRVPLRLHRADLVPRDAAGRPLSLPGAGFDGCVSIEPGAGVTAEVIAGGWFTMTTGGGGSGSEGGVTLTWRDRFGEFPLDVVTRGGTAIQLASPTGSTSLTIYDSSFDTVSACGLVGAPGG